MAAAPVPTEVAAAIGAIGQSMLMTTPPRPVLSSTLTTSAAHLSGGSPPLPMETKSFQLTGSATLATSPPASLPPYPVPVVQVKTITRSPALIQPTCMAYDSTGTCYIAYNKHCIARMDPLTGKLEAYIDSLSGYVDGPIRSARFNHAFRLAAYLDDTLLVADMANNRIRRITPSTGWFSSWQCFFQMSAYLMLKDK
jgi:hypothetical protein